MQIKALIIDDEPLARELIQSYIERLPAIKLVGSYGSATEAVKAIVSGEIDLIFMDINMPCVDGIELAQITPRNTRIVYVTAYEQYAVRAFAAGALDYLLKPLSFEDFSRAVNRAIEWKKVSTAYNESSGSVKNYIIVKSDYKTVQIKLDSILYVEGSRDYVKFILDEEPFEVVSLLNLKRLDGVLPADRFMRVHRSFIINLNKITVIDRARIVFGKLFIPISEAYKEQFNDYIRQHSVKGQLSMNDLNS